jgi:hypothetical protein
MKKIAVYIVLLINMSLWAQGRIVINNNGFIVMQNNAYIVIDNPNPNAITTQGSGGNIISEKEQNKIKWNIGANTGLYTIPFTDNVNSTSGDNAQTVDNGTKIPYTLNITAPATGGNYYEFSTYDGASWDNQNYMPSMVTHMGQLLPPNVANHSDYAIDRFWVVNLIGYATKPSVIHTFTYIDNEITAAGNNLFEINMGAQRFNDPMGTWGDMWPVVASQNTATNVLTTPGISPADFYAAWVLSDINDPLPVKLSDFTANCNLDGSVNVYWTTNFEENNDFFTIQKSLNGIDFYDIGSVQGSGNSNNTIQYEFTDYSKNETAYYRLKQTDFNGNVTLSDAISVNCKTNEFEAYAYNNDGMQITFKTDKEESVNIEVLDARGRLIYTNNLNSNIGSNTISINEAEATGIYFIRLKSATYQKSIKFYKE